jgi:hypothetical protein
VLEVRVDGRNKKTESNGWCSFKDALGKECVHIVMFSANLPVTALNKALITLTASHDMPCTHSTILPHYFSCLNSGKFIA